MADMKEGREVLYICKKCGATYGSKTALPNHLFSKHKVCISAFKKVYDEYVEEVVRGEEEEAPEELEGIQFE